jgi:hypothetical protein
VKDGERTLSRSSRVPPNIDRRSLEEIARPHHSKARANRRPAGLRKEVSREIRRLRDKR